MTFVLIALLIAAIVCIIYAFYLYKQRQRVAHPHHPTVTRNGNNISVIYQNFQFDGHLTVEAMEAAFHVTGIDITFTGPKHLLDGLTKNDLFIIERDLYYHFPEADIVWNEPMNQLFE
ncbi:hypothetical protein [Tuberibacillus sp. Marseille-P3662]|uniref:hypothetical protein n=1 Tax=Tuberibacillus sp. Marseille-P3662 TaxID=1965358 RepID=UPI000A1C9402|nr:hypothetical protein [Tuberibacillus sp. Marseille-P3662]